MRVTYSSLRDADLPGSKVDEANRSNFAERFLVGVIGDHALLQETRIDIAKLLVTVRILAAPLHPGTWRKRLAMTLFNLASKARKSRMDSREMLSGKSSLSTTPRRKRNHSGKSPQWPAPDRHPSCNAG